MPMVVALVGRDLVGFPYSVIVALKVSGNKLEEVLHTLDMREEVKYLVASTGSFDLLAFARTLNTDDTSNFLQNFFILPKGSATAIHSFASR
ncbi:hypothetical protein ACFLWE_00525 [Chloroflexota bacterium]